MEPAEFEVWRSHFPNTQQFAYFDHAAVGPMPDEAVRAIYAAAKAQAEEASGAYEGFLREVETTRLQFAALIGALPEEVAITGNTSTALSAIASGLPWRFGDSVVLPEIEFPANVFPWLNLASAGVEVRRVAACEGRVRIDDILSAVDSTTRAIAISAIQFSNGYRIDLDTLGAACRDRNILLIVDAAQAVGAVQLDVHKLPIDALATSSHKWLLGPFGVGWLYVRRDLIEQLRPHAVGLFSAIPGESLFVRSFNLRSDARRFENGGPNVPGIFGVQASVRLLGQVGMENIESRVLALSDHLADGLRLKGYNVLSPRNLAQERSAIVTFSSPCYDAIAVFNRLIAAKVLVSVRERAIRVAPHFYNTYDEIGQLLDVLPSQQTVV